MKEIITNEECAHYEQTDHDRNEATAKKNSRNLGK